MFLINQSLSGTNQTIIRHVGFAPDAIEFIRFADFNAREMFYGLIINMAQTLVQIFVHVVFSTKNRADMITPEIETELFAYIGGIAANNNSKLVAANGTENHLHLLILLSKTIELSELVGDIKRNSSRWIKSKGDAFKTFGWQDGFAAFSVGQTQVPMVKEYIADQKEKHGKQKFEDEMRMFYDKYGIKYDERYVWD